MKVKKKPNSRASLEGFYPLLILNSRGKERNNEDNRETNYKKSESYIL